MPDRRMPIEHYCSQCGSAPSEPCQTSSGRKISVSHAPRLAATEPYQLRDRLAGHLEVEKYPESAGRDYDGADWVLEMVIDALGKRFGPTDNEVVWLKTLLNQEPR